MAERGGARKGAGRKTKAEEAQANVMLKKALKSIYSKDEDEANIVEFLKDFIKTSKGQLFTAEHLLGKPKDKVDITTLGAALQPNQISFIKSNKDD